MDVFHRDNQTTQDKEVAALAMYLGYELERVEANPDGTVVYTIRCPQFDWEQVLTEAADPETAVCFKSFCSALGKIVGRMCVARKNGAWQRRK